MSERKQNRMLDCLKACGASEDDVLETVIETAEDCKQDKLQDDLLLELNECY